MQVRQVLVENAFAARMHRCRTPCAQVTANGVVAPAPAVEGLVEGTLPVAAPAAAIARDGPRPGPG